MTRAVSDQLEQSSLLTAGFIQNWFQYHLTELKRLSADQNNIILSDRLIKLYNRTSQAEQEYIQSNDWAAIVNNSANDLENVVRYFESVTDLLLLDVDGNILYSVKRDKDLGTNILSGVYSATQFADSIRYVIKNTLTTLSALERYAPSDDDLSCFISIPLMDKNGNVTGVISMKLTPSVVFNQIKLAQSVDSSHRVYLIDEDGLLMSPIEGTDDAERNRLIKHAQSRIWKEDKDRETIRSHPADKSELSYTGPDGYEVIGVHHVISLFNSRWILISEVNKDEALADAIWLKQITFWVVVLVLILIIITLIFQIRHITRPITELARISMDLAEGKNVEPLVIDADNEIGRLAESFNHMLEVRREQEYLLEISAQHAQQVMAELIELKFALDQHAIVAMTDIQGTITFVNEKFTEISGYSKSELIGKNHRLLNSGYHGDEFFKQMYRTIARGQVWHGELCNKAKDGHIYWVDTTIVPFKGEDGKPEKYVAIRADITERKLAETALISAKNEAENAVKAKSEFLASMSHEIRTPMNGVIGMLNLLLNMNLEPDQRHRAIIAQNSAQSLLSLINDILDFSKVEAGKLELDILDFNLRKMLDSVVESMAQQAEDKNLEIIIDTIHVEQSVVRGDPGRLRQIFNNLIGNAIKFTHHGEVRVTVSLEPEGDDHYLLTAQILDTGIGIPAEKLDKLFNSFSQLDASTTRKYGGTGLGLAIAKRLCELMEGTINVTSKPGHGSCFEIRLVLEKSSKSEKVIPPVKTENLTILIVDDHETVLKVISAQLEHWGVTVVQATTGLEAIQICNSRLEYPESKFFDLALIDMHMPDQNGIVLGKTIRDNSRFDQMKLILMTSMKDQGKSKQLTEAGFTTYFPKPVTTADLFRALSTLFEQCPDKTGKYLQLNTRAKSFSHSGTAISDNGGEWPDNYKILLVEDNHINQLVASGTLNDFGLTADVAVNGLDALKKMRLADEKNDPYTLVLMDCQMPEMDGYEASRQIRQGKAGDSHKSVMIAAMTANAMLGDREKCLAAGMNDYMTKPIEVDKLYLSMRSWLSGRLQTNDVHEPELMMKTKEDLNQTVWNQSTILKRLGGNQQTLKLLIAAFCRDIPKNMGELKDAIKTSNVEHIRHHAHTLKGVAANISGEQMQALALIIEKHAKNGQLDQLDSLYSDLDAACQQLMLAMQQYINQQDVPVQAGSILDKDELGRHLLTLIEKLKRSEYIESAELDAVSHISTEIMNKAEFDKLVETIMIFDNQSAIEMLIKISERIGLRYV